MWGIRVIIPESLQSQVLKSLQESHPGISNMKAIAPATSGGMDLTFT